MRGAGVRAPVLALHHAPRAHGAAGACAGGEAIEEHVMDASDGVGHQRGHVGADELRRAVAEDGLHAQRDLRAPRAARGEGSLVRVGVCV